MSDHCWSYLENVALGLCGKVLVSGWPQRWFLWRDTRMSDRARDSCLWEGSTAGHTEPTGDIGVTAFRSRVQLQPTEDPSWDKLDAWGRLLLRGELMPEQAPGRTCALVERGVHSGEGLLAGLVALKEIRAGSACSWGTGLCEGAPGEQFVKNCRMWEWPMLGKFMKDCIQWEGPHSGAGWSAEATVIGPWEFFVIFFSSCPAGKQEWESRLVCKINPLQR